MERIIFVSSASRSLQPADLDSIAEMSSRNNKRDNLTGLLILGDGTFFQVVEGPAEQMKRTIERIKTDLRHTGMSVLHQGPADERMFPDWSLGCYRTNLATNQTTWKMVDVEEILDGLPPSPAPEVEVFLRTFFGTVAGRNPL